MNTKKFSMKFYPRTDKTNKQGLAPIYARIITEKKIELSTTMFTLKENWDIKAQRLNKNAIDADTLNPFLDSFQSKILDVYSKLFIEGKQISSDILKERIFGRVEKEKTLLQVVREHKILRRE